MESKQGMTSGERATAYRNRQIKAGRKLVTLYLSPEAISRLRKLSRKRTTREFVEQAIQDLWAAYSGSDAKSGREKKETASLTV